ncbi:DUF6350 family protein [Streptomyces sp. TR06-5]|uniref:cell division protein PerM n=1 Tax=unclassified Streptomyces TaxID=2593676 RepID=UPI00399EF607
MPQTRPARPTHPDGPDTPHRTAPGAPARSTAALRLLGGAVAFALGLGLCTVLVLLLWIGTPASHGAPDEALHVAAAVWLTAHGVDLVRDSTVTGEPVPLALTPLLLTALPLWLLHRAVRNALDTPPARVTATGPVLRAAGTAAAGYLLPGAALIAATTDGPLRVNPYGAVLRLALFVAVVSAAAAWLSLGRPAPRLPASAAPLWRPASRAAALATSLLLVGGLLLTLVALARGSGAVFGGTAQLGGSWAGYAAVVLLAFALLPNAAVWAASYALGPGFSLGGGSTVAPLTATPVPHLPPFPLLAGLPAEEVAGRPIAWAAAAVPPAAALATGWYLGRAASPVAAPVPPGGAVEDTALGPWRTVLAAAVAGCGCATALGALASLSGGALGTGTLRHVGPLWWATGGAALAWTAAVGVPTAWGVRAWRLRQRLGARERMRRVAAAVAGLPAALSRLLPTGPLRFRRAGEKADRAGAPTGSTGSTASGADGTRQGDWHDTGARRTRWAALKEASGGLMADFPPRDRD